MKSPFRLTLTLEERSSSTTARILKTESLGAFETRAEAEREFNEILDTLFDDDEDGDESA